MKKLTLKASKNYWLLASDGMAVVSSKWVRGSGLLLDHDENTRIEIPCMCNECMLYEVWGSISGVCGKNKITTLIVDNSRHGSIKDVAIVSMRDVDQLPPRFKLLPFHQRLEGGMMKFHDRKEMLRWCICQPSILFELESVSQFRQSYSLDFVRGVNNKELIPWLKEMKVINPNFDPMKFMEYLNARAPIGKAARDLDIPKIIDDLF